LFDVVPIRKLRIPLLASTPMDLPQTEPINAVTEMPHACSQ
jgi:hypothetical protein